MSRRKKVEEALESSAEALASSDAAAYARRLVEDAELRATLGRGLDASRSAYERVAKARKPAKLLDDKKLQSDVQEALEAFRDAAVGVTAGAKATRRKGKRFGRKLMILGLGGGLALVASEDLRKKVLDTLFGAEEEFQYTPPAAPTEASAAAPPPPAEAPAEAPAPDGAA
jgi:hypothetical protein